MEKNELKNLDSVILEQEVLSWKRELLNLRFSMRAGQVKDFSQLAKIRTMIARALTILSQRRNENKMNKSKSF